MIVPPAKGVGLGVADSHTGNHPEDDFMPLETIRRSYSATREKISFELEGETFELERGCCASISETFFDAPHGYVGLYTPSFSLANLGLPLTEFFCEVLKYFQVHISRLNPFGGANLTTFIVMCKAYGCEPSLDLFRTFFNLCRAGKWLTFAKRSEKHILNLLPKVITCIEVGTNGFSMFEIPFPCQEPSPRFSIGSPSASVNTEPPKYVKEPEVQLVEVTADSEESSKSGVFVVYPGSVVARIKERKCKTRGGSSRPPLKRKLASRSSSSRVMRTKTSASKDDAPFLSISDNDNGQFLVIEKMSGEADVIKAKERSHEEECEGIQVKCEAAMAEFDKNPAVLALQEKISSLTVNVKEHKGNLDRIMLESQKYAVYQVTLSTLESKVNSLEADKASDELGRLIGKLVSFAITYGHCKAYEQEAVEGSLRKEVGELKQDRRDVVSKVIHYAAMELVHSDELGRLVGKLVSFAITYGHCKAYEQVAAIKDPFDLSKAKGYRSSYKKDHT
nr:hypothetical protein [Tanacetum cinerariifolium]